MTLPAFTLTAAFLLLVTLSSSSIAVADGVGWNPFLFISTCSSCGPLTPLTLEQADGGQVSSGNAPGVANANGLALAAAPGIGPIVSVGGGNDNGLNYGLTLVTNSTDAINSDGEGANAPNHELLAFNLLSSSNEGDAADTNSVTPLSLTDGTGSGSGSAETLAPEPTSMLLFGSGLAIVSALARRKRRPRL